MTGIRHMLDASREELDANRMLNLSIVGLPEKNTVIPSPKRRIFSTSR